MYLIMMRGKIGGRSFLFLMMVLATTSILIIAEPVSADWTDWFSKITGRATTGTSTVSITIANSGPTIVNVSNIDAVTLTEGLGFNVSFNFTAGDIDGSADLDNATAFVWVNKTGEDSRGNNSHLGYVNSSCLPLAFVQGNNITYGCNFTFYYWDGNGDWTINVSIADQSGTVAQNVSTKVTVNLLTAMTMTPPTLNWSSVQLSDIDTGSSNDPITINNTGNDINLSIQVTAYSLQGETTTTESIEAENFTVENTADGCSGTALVNATITNITSAHLNNGNNTIQAGDVSSGQEEIYFCLKAINPGISSQAYSGAGAVANWTITATT